MDASRGDAGAGTIVQLRRRYGYIDVAREESIVLMTTNDRKN